LHIQCSTDSYSSYFQLDEASNQEDNNESSSSNQNLAISLVRRVRRLVSQPTLQENNLDNEINNYPQHLNAEEEEDDDDDDGESSDRLFEEYLQEASQSGQAQLFDCELPTQHTYLGSTENVRGFSYFEPYKTYEIPICEHHSLVFPGEILPMIMLEDRFFSLSNSLNEGLLFGLIFQKDIEDEKQTYGVTCQIFEKGSQNGLVKIKSKAQQRFVVVKSNNEESITMRNQGYFAKVKILPEIVLPDPYLLTISNNYLKHLQNNSNRNQLQRFLAASTRWPRFVYEEYSIATVTDKIERYLAMLNIEAPTDPILKSFWLARNVPLNHTDRLKVFQTNCVNKRLMLIGDSLNYVS
jgi:cereblon